MINIRKVANGYLVTPELDYHKIVQDKEVLVFNKFSDLVEYLKDKLEK